MKLQLIRYFASLREVAQGRFAYHIYGGIPDARSSFATYYVATLV